jgi:nitrite reductase (NADH) small subunit
MEGSLSFPDRHWYDLGPLRAFPPGEGRTFNLAGQWVAVFRTREGEVYATQASCPHRQGPLADGIIGGSTLVCPLHAYRFDLRTGEALGHTCPALRTYRVSVTKEGDRVLVEVD